MPKKTNKRKAIQSAKRASQAKPKPRNIGTIAHVGMGGHGLAMAVLASGIMRQQERRPLDGLRASSKEPKT